MKRYIACCEWDGNDISLLLVGYTDNHYITGGDLKNSKEVGMQYIWKSINKENEKFNYEDARFDPLNMDAKWTIQEKYIFDDFEQACSSLFKQLF